jgi:hypothetical protein
MTSEEAPEYTSELNILSPVSPKPVHYPVPSNIPVLENQIDPVFNQTGTHMVEPISQQLPPPMYLDQRAGMYNQDLHQQQHHVQHAQSHLNHPEAYMTQQAVGLGQTQAPSQNQGPQAYHQAQEQASSIGTDSQTNQVPPVVHYDEKYSYQPAASGAVASSDALAPATASVPSDLPYPSTAAHHLPALSTQSNNEASFQSNSFQAQSHANSSSANASVSELPPGVEANSLQSLLNNLSHASHSQAQSTSPSSQVAQTPSNAANSANNVQQEQAYPTYTNDVQAQQAQQPQQHQQQQQEANGGHTTNHVGANGLPPPPVASFQQAIKLESQRERKQAAGEALDEDDQPWTPETQHRYDNFLTEERKYVTEGNWEQFPYGSRLFVGNLSSERVTKRDIFHVFHKYGDLAQISIKQAYGFVQFLESVGCSKAINAEQGKTIRGKKIRKSKSIENE